MASIVDKIVTNVSAGIENAIHFLDSFVHSKEETGIKVKTDSESDKLPSREEVKSKLDEKSDKLEKKASELGDKASEKLSNAYEKVADKLPTKEEIKEKTHEAQHKTEEKADEAKDKAKETGEKVKDTAAEAWDATKAKASEIKEDVKEKADNASERLHKAWNDLAHPNHPHHHPESKSPVGGASLNMAEVLSAENSLILPGSASGNNTSAVDPSVFSVAVPVNQLPEIAPTVSDF